MKYEKTIRLKDGRTCLLRNAEESDGKDALAVFERTHAQTDHLLSYPDEIRFTPEEEGRFLKEKAQSDREIEILALVDNKIVGMAGVEAVGPQYKVSHRAECGVSIDRAYWGLGIGRALLDGCIESARKAGYAQLELQVVAENERAITMYRHAGFTEFGRNPKGFRSRASGFQELIDMHLEL